MMATDTANFRNANYRQPTDTPDTIDQDFLLGSTRSALAGLVTYGSVDDDGDGKADICTRDLSASATTSTTSTPTTSTTVAATEPTGAQPVSGQASFTG